MLVCCIHMQKRTSCTSLSIAGHPSSVDALVAFDEDTVLTGSQDGLIRIISILPNSMLGVVGEHGDFPVETLALSHDRCVRDMLLCVLVLCLLLFTSLCPQHRVRQQVAGRPHMSFGHVLPGWSTNEPSMP